ncbi:MAG: helix-turn-helix domain-containing protein [Thermoanaerobaculia bacterium]|nr:helix-turn-helix domain-containing protein [Myxococcota bacterium]MCK6682666.1 helix-turn-helix domain-containing protein [Thermoanaerobaculia bacterium]
MKTTEAHKNPRKRTHAVLNLRRFRQSYGDHGLTRQDLARRSGVSVRMIREYEKLTRLPRSVENILRLAAAINRGPRSLIDPRTLMAVVSDVKERSARTAPTHDRCRRRHV